MGELSFVTLWVLLEPTPSRRAMMRIPVLVICFITVALAIPTPGHADEFDSQPEKVIGVEIHKNIRVVYDDKDDVWDAGIGKGLW
jgi:hypothetical protein